MKIAISTESDYVSAHFGRCPHYTLVEIEGDKVLTRELIDSPGHQPGFLPGFLAERGITCVITGGMGPRAQSLFTQQGIETVVGVSGKVDEVIEKLLKGELEGGESLCEHGENPCQK
ncbi:MAG: NifB/NifX family molybdenum-iron cluster-binding protein [Candidatus Aminicenantes bacterium]|nr:NifB/NifX family molybdenum-iron cluster-binding protein [Candidatus Aminicenantes bacterium]